jgi:hypothetical protein
VEVAEAARAVAEVDRRENDDRAARLVELDSLLAHDSIGFSGQSANWLFEDVKATWIYGYFTATILAASAFCLHQLAGLVRMLPDDPGLPEEASSLDELAEMAERLGLIDVATRARLVILHDLATIYLRVGLHEYRAQVERRVAEAERFAEEPALLSDARTALHCSVALLHRMT